MEKYILVHIPTEDENGKKINWWVPEQFLKVITVLEKNTPEYDFHQIVTSPGNGGYREFAVMKLKTKL
jgi:hypothetical protein